MIAVAVEVSVAVAVAIAVAGNIILITNAVVNAVVRKSQLLPQPVVRNDM